MTIDDLTIGMESITILSVNSSQGGMRRSKRINTLVLVSNRVVSTYSDDWDGDTLLYTGMGKKATRA